MTLHAHTSPPTRLEALRMWLAHAFATDRRDALDDADRALLVRMADWLVRRGMGETAVMALETARPLNFIGSQALVFLRPFVHMVFKRKADYDRFTTLLEDRHSTGEFIRILEARLSQSKSGPEVAP